MLTLASIDSHATCAMCFFGAQVTLHKPHSMLFNAGLWLCRPHQYVYYLIKIRCFPGNPVGICCMIIRIGLERTLLRDNNFITAKALVYLWSMSGSNNRAVLIVKKYVHAVQSCVWIQLLKSFSVECLNMQIICLSRAWLKWRQTASNQLAGNCPCYLLWSYVFPAICQFQSKYLICLK